MLNSYITTVKFCRSQFYSQEVSGTTSCMEQNTQRMFRMPRSSGLPRRPTLSPSSPRTCQKASTPGSGREESCCLVVKSSELLLLGLSLRLITIYLRLYQAVIKSLVCTPHVHDYWYNSMIRETKNMLNDKFRYWHSGYHKKHNSSFFSFYEGGQKICSTDPLGGLH